MTRFRLRTLGGVALERDGAVLDHVGAQRKTLALLTLLAVTRAQGVSRERVAALIWPESDTEHARGALKQTLHLARRHLGSPAAIAGTSELRLNPTYVDSDVGAFLDALEGGHLELAVSLYGGPFLDGFHLPGAPEFEEWASLQRHELARRYTSALERIAAAAEERGEWEAAVEWLRRAQVSDPLSVRTTLRLMRALDQLGERVAALRCAQVHEALLREQLDSPPDPAVAALAAQLRREVDESATLADPRPRSGATPSAAAEPPGLREPGSGSVAPVPARRLPRRSVLAAVIVVVVLALAVFMAERRSSGNETLALQRADRSIAVLPLENVSRAGTIDHLATAFTDDLSQLLRRVDALRVAPHSSILALQGRGLDDSAIADSLDVAAVVDGTLDQVGDRLEVTVRLVNPRSRVVLWSESYQRTATDIATLPAEIADRILYILYQERLGAASSRPSRSTDDPEAYDLYLRGRHAWRQRTREGIQQAIIFFEAAIDRDPAFAAAYAGLAASYVNCSNFAWCDVQEGLARADVAARRALDLDSFLAEGLAAKGFVHASRLEFAASEAAFQRAIQLNGSITWAHHYYSLLLLMVGRTHDALEQNRQALALDPLSLPANATRGIIFLQDGDLDLADRELQRALQLSPEFQLTLYYLGVTRAARGQLPDAGQLLARAASTSPAFPGVRGAQAVVLRRSGQPAAADSILARLRIQAETGGSRARLNLGLAHGALGNLDAAFAMLDDDAEWDVPALIELRADPLLASLRSDPRYHALLRRIGIPPQNDGPGRPDAR